MTDWTNPDEREAAVAKKWADAEAALVVERAISDKLEKALDFYGRNVFRRISSNELLILTAVDRDAGYRARATLAEVAAMRNQETAAVKTYCGGKPNYVNEDKA